jgi:hypothetical protein
MRCTSVEKLLPLYVEDDLHEREAGEVSSHLSSCEGCQSLAEELRASQRRLHAFAAPEFDEEFYLSIRRAVLAEINSGTRTRPSLLNIFAAPFSFRPALAASLILLIFFSGAALLYKRLSMGGGSRSDARMVAIEKSSEEIKASAYYESFGSEGAGALTGEPGKASAPQSGPASARVIRRSVRPRGQTAEAARERVAARSSGVASTAMTARAQTEKENNNTAASTDAVARMEIQTSDPNIRIIWLARKSSE